MKEVCERHVVTVTTEMIARYKFKKLLEYLEMCDDLAFPKMRTDRELLSFRNGVLHLTPPLEFQPYPAHDAIDADKWADGVAWAKDKTARPHLDVTYTQYEMQC